MTQEAITHIDQIPTPAVLIETRKLEHNLRTMQAHCEKGGAELWPHCKTHKLVPILQRQLAHGAQGATCAKLSEAEALLPSGVRRIFVAHSLAFPLIGPRVKRLAESLDELILAVTGTAYFDVLESFLKKENLHVSVLMAVDTGLNREGVRTPEEAKALAARISQSAQMEFRGIYTHEGHAYAGGKDFLDPFVAAILQKMEAYAEAIGGKVLLWPGCSVTAAAMADTKRVHAVRPGAYLFGDLYLAEVTSVMRMEDAAVTILTTVVDRPAKDLALIDAGSKTFSGDKIPRGVHGDVVGHPGVSVTRVNEEHGYIADAPDDLKIGTRIRCIPAHVCPVINLTSKVYLVDGDQVLETWAVDARGCVT